MTDSQVPYTVSVNSSISDLQHYNGSTAPWLRGTGSIMWNSLRVVIYDDITEVNCIVHENRSVGVLWPRYLQLVWQRGIEAEPLLQMSARYWRRASLTECLQGIDAATLTSYNMSKVPKQCLLQHSMSAMYRSSASYSIVCLRCTEAVPLLQHACEYWSRYLSAASHTVSYKYDELDQHKRDAAFFIHSLDNMHGKHTTNYCTQRPWRTHVTRIQQFTVLVYTGNTITDNI